MTLVSLDFDAHLPTPQEVHTEIPRTPTHETFIDEARTTIQAILEGRDSRKLLIAGPCSIHDPESALEYAHHFKELATQVQNHFYLVMRAYVEKPRTITGWKGLLYDPDLDGSHNLAKGIRRARTLLSDLTDLRIPLASELLDGATAPYYADFLSWGCIGARTTTSPPHRQLASTLTLPIGFKNTTDGNVDHAIHGVLSARSRHTYLGLSHTGHIIRIHGKGNPHCHIVLRGGHDAPNYHPKSVLETVEKCEQAGIYPKVVIDCSHDNCEKRHLKQVAIFQDVIEQIAEGNESIVGLMLESNLLGGSQPISDILRYGVSITDPCLDWKTTHQLITSAAAHLEAGASCLI